MRSHATWTSHPPAAVRAVIVALPSRVEAVIDAV
jgi:hypothetical protein